MRTCTTGTVQMEPAFHRSRIGLGPTVPGPALHGLARRRTVELEMMDDDDPYQTDERGIADLGPMLIAWFRDPDNQVISVFQLTPERG